MPLRIGQEIKAKHLMPTQHRDRVFVSYSHKDDKWLEKFKALLSPDIRNGRVDFWDDRELRPGDPWHAKIVEGIGAARVAVLLVSPNFLASRFIMDEELPRILAGRDDGLVVIWVPLFGTFYGPTAPPQFEAITEIQAAFDASKPLADQAPASQTVLLLGLCRQIQRLLNPSRIPSNLPFTSLAGLFKGRNEALNQLDCNLRNHGSAAIVQPQAIQGLGGIGKTRLAIEYAWHHKSDFTAFLFVSANTSDDLDRNLAALSRPDCLDLPEHQSPQQRGQRDAVIRWLQQNEGWLLIVDNVDTDDGVHAVKAMVATLRGGHIIITSRMTEWGRAVQPLALEVLQPNDAVAVLLESAHSWRAPRSEDAKQARILVDRLGNLPLALSHATAYMQHHHQGFIAYLDDFEKHVDRLLAYHDHLAIEYETELEEKTKKAAAPENRMVRKEFIKTVATTFLLSFDRLAPEAKAILQSAAFLASDPIPVGMFEECLDEVMVLVNLWCEGSGEVKSEQSVADALAELSRYSLITRGEKAFSIHRMVQLVLRSRVAIDRIPSWIEGIRAALFKYAPDETAENPETWPLWDVLRPHVETLIALVSADECAEHHCRLYAGLGQLYYGKGLYQRALEVDEKMLSLAQKKYPANSGEVAHRFLSLGESLHMLGRNSDAENAFRASLAIREVSDGPKSARVAEDLNYLATAIEGQGRLEEAEVLQRKAITIYEQQPSGSCDAAFAKSLNNLAQLLERKKLWDELLKLRRKALPLAENGFGRDHPKTLICVINLAGSLEKVGNFDEAQELYTRAIDGFMKSLGLEHPFTMVGANNFSHFLRVRGCPDLAESYSRKIVKSTERFFGESHPLVIHRRNNLALNLIMLDKLDEAHQILISNWHLNAPPYANTTPRIAFLRHLIALLDSQPDTPFLGQLKTFLTGPELPVTSLVVVPWGIVYFIEFLRPKLGEHRAEFLTALVAALNDRAKVPELEQVSEWKNQPPVPLDAPWR